MGTDELRLGRQPTSAAETRERLIQAAVEVFLEQGYDQVRVQDITRRAGFTAGALYAHFDSRTSILAEAITRQGKQLVDEMTSAIGSMRPGNGTILQVLAALITDEPRPLDKLMTEAIALAARDESTRAVLLPAFESLREHITVLVNMARDHEIIHESIEIEALSTLFMTMLFGAIVGRALNTPRASTTQMNGLFDRLRLSFQFAQT